MPMASINKIIMGTAIGAGVIALIRYLVNMRRASAHLEVIPTANIHSISWTGLKIRVDAILKNPTAASFWVKFPYIRVSHKDTTLGSSQVVNKDIQVPAYGQVVIQDMMIEINTISFFSVVYDMIKALNNNETIALTVQIITTIDLGWSKLPYEMKKEINLKK